MSGARLPTIERPTPICNDVFRAFDDISCSAERLRALFSNNTASLNEAIERLGGASPVCQNLFEIGMIFTLAVEKFTELESDIAATQDAFLKVRSGHVSQANYKAGGNADVEA